MHKLFDGRAGVAARRRVLRRVLVRAVRHAIAALVVMLPVTAAAQTCAPSTTSNEADLFGIRSLSLAMSRGTGIVADTPGTVRAGVEIAYLPHIDNATARPTTCRPGKNGESVNALPAVARARVMIALSRRFALDASWLPPVRLEGIRSNLVGVGLGQVHPISRNLALAGRGHAVFGNVRGPFTCPEEALDDADSECHQGTVSDDRFEPNIAGIDFTLGSARPGSYTWFAGGGLSRLRPRFRVNFLNQSGILDTTRVVVDLNRIALFAGVTRTIGERLRASGEVYATTQDGATARLVLDGVLRRGK